MNQLLLVIAVALTTGAIVFGVIALLAGDDGGLRPAEPDGRAIPLPVDRPLIETDVTEVRFDTAVRGYRMAQVDAALRRLAYDIGYKDELVKVLQAEVDALRAGRFPEAEVMRRAREAALAEVPSAAVSAEPAGAAPTAPLPAPDGLADREGPADRAEPAKPEEAAEPQEPAGPEGRDGAEAPGDPAGAEGPEAPAGAEEPAKAPAGAEESAGAQATAAREEPADRDGAADPENPVDDHADQDDRTGDAQAGGGGRDGETTTATSQR